MGAAFLNNNTPNAPSAKLRQASFPAFTLRFGIRFSGTRKVDELDDDSEGSAAESREKTGNYA